MQSIEVEKAIDKLERNGDWLNRHFKEISEKHLNEFIAIKDIRIIAHNSDFENLLQELKAKKEDLNEILIEFVHGKEYEVIM